jgi:hypothetical protein
MTMNGPLPVAPVPPEELDEPVEELEELELLLDEPPPPLPPPQFIRKINATRHKKRCSKGKMRLTMTIHRKIP